MAPIRIRLRELRRSRGLTQVQLAELCGMPQSTISRIESGSTTGVDFATLHKVASVLEVHPSDLIAFDQVVFDHRGKSYLAEDVTLEVPDLPEGATTMWSIRGTHVSFDTGPGAEPADVIKKAKKLLGQRRT